MNKNIIVIERSISFQEDYFSLKTFGRAKKKKAPAGRKKESSKK